MFITWVFLSLYLLHLKKKIYLNLKKCKFLFTLMYFDTSDYFARVLVQTFSTSASSDHRVVQTQSSQCPRSRSERSGPVFSVAACLCWTCTGFLFNTNVLLSLGSSWSELLPACSVHSRHCGAGPRLFHYHIMSSSGSHPLCSWLEACEQLREQLQWGSDNNYGRWMDLRLCLWVQDLVRDSWCNRES